MCTLALGAAVHLYTFPIGFRVQRLSQGDGQGGNRQRDFTFAEYKWRRALSWPWHHNTKITKKQGFFLNDVPCSTF